MKTLEEIAEEIADDLIGPTKRPWHVKKVLAILEKNETKIVGHYMDKYALTETKTKP